MRMRISRNSLSLLFAFAIGCILFGCSQNTQAPTAPKNRTIKETETAKSAPNVSAPSETPDQKSDSKALATKVYMPPKAIGHVKMSYMAAKQIPEILQQLFCYCGCDQVHEHTSLFDCFKDDHSVECSYCLGEAIMSFKMNKKGCSIADIQKSVDLNWGPHYPFPEQFSNTIKNYWKTRLWAPGDVPTPAEKPNDKKPLFDPFTQAFDRYSKVTGSPIGNCCAGK